MTWIAWPLLGSLLGSAVGPDYRFADDLHSARTKIARIEGRANLYSFSTQNNVALSEGPNGEFALTWESRRQRKGLPGVYWRAFDAWGTPRTQEEETTSDKLFPQETPSIAHAGKQYRVSYSARNRDREPQTVHLEDGRPDANTKGNKRNPQIVFSKDGRGVMVWLGEVGHLETRVFARTIDEKGQFVGKPFLVQDDTAATQPTVAGSAEGFVVVWQTFNGAGKPSGLSARRYAWSGSPKTPVVRVANASAIEPSIDVSRSGIAIGWVQAMRGNRYEVRAQRFDASLRPTGSSVRAPKQPGDQNAAAVALDEKGMLALAWNHRQPTDSDVYAMVLKPDNRPYLPAVRVTRESMGMQAMADATGARRILLRDGWLTVAWSGQAGFDDATSANFTRLAIDGRRLPSAAMALINESSSRPVAAHGTFEAPRLFVDRTARIDTAEPHDPPISDYKNVQQPWDVQVPMNNGGFNAYSQTSFTPPDHNIAVGPDWLVVTVNDGIGFYKKDGTMTYSNNMRLTNGFWGSLAASDNFIYDPECFYDHLTGRFFVMATQGAGTSSDSAALVGVSDDGNPNGTWYLYRFLTTGLAGNFFDSPNFGVDANVLYITGDGFGLGSNYPVYCIEKAPLLVGQNPSIIKSTTLTTSTQSAGISPVQDSGNRYYMVEHKEASNNTAIDIIALRDPLTNPTFQRFTLTVSNYGPPANAPQSGSSSRVSTFDARFWSVKWRNGFLWATHHINSARTLARWYQIDVRGWPTSGNNPIVVQSGNIDIASGIWTFFPSIGVDDSDNVAIAYARSSTSEFYSSAHSFRRHTDALGTMGNHTIDKVSTGPYTAGRWGDYSGCESDPQYPGLMWGIGEWAEGNNWRVWVQPFYVTNELWALSFNTIRGTLQVGGIKDLIKQDGSSLVHRSTIRLNSNDPFISVELQTATFKRNQASATITFTYNVDQGGFRLATDVFDHAANQWVEIDSRVASVSSTTITIPVPNPQNYVRNADGLIRARYRVMANGPTATSTVRIFADRWAWIEN